eukprot:SAG31_NODE_3513_length_4171_cov_2.135527_6_plen_40_part_00
MVNKRVHIDAACAAVRAERIAAEEEVRCPGLKFGTPPPL